MSTLNVNPLDIKLDVKNPRFIIPPDSTQESLRLYLLENENIVGLAEKIVQYGGLMPGERIVVTEENGSLIALEGNRRICTLQLLLNPDLIPNNFKTRIPAISQDLRSRIENIEVDFVTSRNTTLNVLATRHISGPKKWSPVSKQKFYANLFEAGKTVDEISELTLTKKDKVRTQLQEYYLLQYALGLPVWNDEQKINILKIKPTVFNRLFNVEGARESLGLSFDPETCKPVSALPKEKFDKAVELIATAAFITKTVNTRSELKDVPGLADVINIVDKSSPTSPSPQGPSTGQNKIFREHEPQPQSQVEQHTNDKQETKPSEELKPNQNKTMPESKPENPPLFFENVACNIPNSDPDGTGILAIIKEIRYISTPGYLARFPIAASMLLRSLLEQTLKYHLKKINKYSELKKIQKGNDPTLQQIITYINSNIGTVLPDKTMERLFKCVFSNVGLKDALDLVVHHTDLVRLDSKTLESISKAGLRGLIECILTFKYP